MNQLATQRNIVIAFMFLFIFAGCKDEEINIVPKTLRSNVILSIKSIEEFNNAQQIRTGEEPRINATAYNDSLFYVSTFNYFWQISDTTSVNILLVVTDSREDADKYLETRRKLSSIPADLYFKKDNPTIAGDISFGGGVEFIKDNIVIHIITNGVSDHLIKILAKDIDQQITNSTSYHSIEDVKPVISQFKLTKNPIKRDSSCAILINLIDPLDKQLYIRWRFVGGAGNRTGTFKNESEAYFYKADTDETEDQLTMIVGNQYGFCNDSTIIVEIQPN